MKLHRNKSPLPLSPRGLALLLALVLFTASGAHCPQVIQQYTQPIPRALQPSATLEQVLQVVNDNSSKVQSYYASRATVSTPGFPALKANIAFQRPRNFRLRAETAFTGPEVDVGSNDELFWLWIRRNQPPSTFYCRHDQFAGSMARQIMPIEPEWLISALGVVSFDPGEQHQGPNPVRGGRLEIRSTAAPAPGAAAPGMTRLTVVDDSRGIVLEQHVYDPQGTLLASALMSRHVRDPASGVTLPRHIGIQWPPAKLELNVDLADVQINRLDGNSMELWIKPQYPGFSDLNLAGPSGAPPTAPAANGPVPIPPVSVRY